MRSLSCSKCGSSVKIASDLPIDFSIECEVCEDVPRCACGCGEVETVVHSGAQSVICKDCQTLLCAD